MMPIKTPSPRQLTRLPDGTHRVAAGLYLQVRGGSRLWTLRYQLAGKARTMSLGSFESVPVEAAIAAAAAARMQIKLHGIDVLVERRAQRAEQRAAITEARAKEPQPIRKSGHDFGELLDVAVDAEAIAKNWKPGADVRARWLSPIKRYCTALISKDVAALTEQMVVDCLAPHWMQHNTMAVRVLGRVICVMGHARRLGWFEGDNPVVLERAKEKLPRVGKARTQHHPAMRLPAMPGFMAKLAADNSSLAQLFRVLILSGVRAGEAAGMRWSEIDLAERLWTIPGGSPESRLKRWQHGDFRVPISDGVAAILQARHDDFTDDGDGLVFPSAEGEAFTANHLTGLLRQNGFPQGSASVHGMRSTLRGFLSQHCDGDHVAKELCLHHEVRTDTQLAYDRDDRLRERRGMLAAWDGYCAGRVVLDHAENVVALPLRHAAIAA